MLNIGDTLQLVGGLGFIVGMVLLSVAGSLDVRRLTLEEFAKMGVTRYNVVHILIALAPWAMLMGWVAVYSSISSGSAADWARLGFYLVLVGTAIWSATPAHDFEAGRSARQWAAATEPEKTAWFVAWAASARNLVTFYGMAFIAYGGGAMFLGVGMVQSDLYPGWAGWSLAPVGLLNLLVGLSLLLAGPGKLVTGRLVLSKAYIALITTSGLLSVWMVALGIWMLAT